MATPLRAGQSWLSPGAIWTADVTRVARDGSWADLVIGHWGDGGPTVWSKRQPLGEDGLPPWFAKHRVTLWTPDAAVDGAS